MLVDLFRNTYNDDTDKKQLRNECEWAKRAESFVYLHRKHTIFSIFWYNDVLVLCNLYGRNYKMYLQNSKKLTPPPPPPPSTLLMTSIGSVDIISIEWWGHFFPIFSSSHPLPPGPRYSFLHLPFSQSSPSPSGPSPPPPFLNLLCRLRFLPFS